MGYAEAFLAVLVIGFVVVASELYGITQGLSDVSPAPAEIAKHVENIDDALEIRGTIYKQLVDIERAIDR
jgi:hypothetical protein